MRRPLSLLLVLLLLSPLLARCREESSASPEQGKVRNLVVITIDTVRRDHLGVYGYSRPTSPEIDRLAARGMVFDSAWSQETNTNPSHCSMFTGLYPYEHGAQQNGQRMDPSTPTLARMLRDHGFATGAFVGGTTLKAAVSGLENGFAMYDDRFPGKRRNSSITVDHAEQWLREIDPAQRYLLFVHFWDAHGPYEPAPEDLELFQSSAAGPELDPARIPLYQRRTLSDGSTDRNAANYLDRYDAQIHHVDALVGRLMKSIDLSDTAVIILADHGETLLERPWIFDHGGRVYDEQIHIPMIILAPDIGSGRADTNVETVDLLPTALDLLNIPLPPSVTTEGQSLLPLLKGESIPGHQRIYSCARPERQRSGKQDYRLDHRRRICSVRTDRWKLIAYPGIRHDDLELYDLTADPGEQHDVLAEHEEIARDLLSDLNQWNPQRRHRLKKPDLTREQEESLRSLGYLGGQ